ncbi:MAG TPA: restriction endonuclease subunit S [Gammaproteobacteria bacterium]|nr:restriction endonuclease subunit S [Gammaproteobacteria bacterium]
MSTAVHHSMEGWPKYRLRFLLKKTRSEDELSKLKIAQEVSFVPMEAIGEQGELDVTQTKPKEEVSNGYTLFFDGDVLVAKITPCFENGKGAVARGLAGGIGFGTTELYVLDPSDKLDEQYLYYLTVSEPFRKFGEASMKGAAGQKRVPDEFIQDYRLDIPPLETQRRIADYLDRETARIDALVAEKEKMLALLEEKRTALISSKVTRGLDPNAPLKPSGLDWLGDIPAHWETSKFSWVVYIAEGQVDPENARYLNYALIAPNHIESGTGKLLLRETAEEQGAISGKYPCRPGDVIYSKIRPALRKACLAEEECLCSADMYPLRPYGMLDPEFLLYLLLSDQFSTWAVLESQRVAMPKINRETLNELRIPVPPISEQRDISVFLRSNLRLIDRQREAILDSVSLLRERRATLITAAVTGQLDPEEMAA